MREMKARIYNRFTKTFRYFTLYDFLPLYAGEDEKTIQWYTGLKDKNGKEIYEGDIVDEGYCQGRAEVVFLDAMYFTKPVDLSIEEFMRSDDFCGYEECLTFLCQSRAQGMTVIGNIFENSDLLKLANK